MIEENKYWKLPIVLNGKKYNVYGGPYFFKPEEYFGVKLAGELNYPCDVDLPIEDFSVPKDIKKLNDQMENILKAIIRGEKVYIGCMGGKGRTGIILSMLAVLSGEKKPITYVRNNYNAHAVETQTQGEFIYSFDYKKLFDFLKKESQPKIKLG